MPSGPANVNIRMDKAFAHAAREAQFRILHLVIAILPWLLADAVYDKNFVECLQTLFLESGGCKPCRFAGRSFYFLVPPTQGEFINMSGRG